MPVSIVKATQEHVPELAPLLDAYRIFYKQESDLDAAMHFLWERFRLDDSVIFMARAKNKAAGFVQLYQSYSTVSLKPIYILNDLYVSKSVRKMGIGEALLRKAQEHCDGMAFKGLALETSIDNPAQALYERLGWKKDVHCFHYFWTAG
jgi:ribosomal protein S18 acetylase RimI-like enzyme